MASRIRWHATRVTPVSLVIYDTVEEAENNQPKNIRKRAIDTLREAGFTEEQIASLV